MNLLLRWSQWVTFDHYNVFFSVFKKLFLHLSPLTTVLEGLTSATPYLNNHNNLLTGFPTSQPQSMLLLDQCSYQSTLVTSFLKTHP